MGNFISGLQKGVKGIKMAMIEKAYVSAHPEGFIQPYIYY